MVLVGLEVADANRGESENVRGDGPRRDEEDLLRPRDHPVRDLEARVPLADHDDPLAFVLVRLPCLDVVRDVLDARNRHLQRVGDADGEHRDLAPVLAVRRGQDEAVLLAAGRLPAAAVPDGHSGPVRERRQPLLHLRAGRNHPRAVHELGDECLLAALLAQQAVVVVPLVGASTALDGRVGLCPGEEPLVDRPLAEHPARGVVLRDDRVLDAEPLQAVARLQPAGAAPDHDDGILAGREGPRV